MAALATGQNMAYACIQKRGVASSFYFFDYDIIDRKKEEFYEFTESFNFISDYFDPADCFALSVSLCSSWN